MKNKIILYIGFFLIFSIKLLAMGGPHNALAPSSTAANNQICVYCHVPHVASSVSGIGPLWNKRTSSVAFAMYGGTIAGNSTAAVPTNQSAACLSCHDGVSAINGVINAPGSGSQNIYVIDPYDPTTVLLNGPGDPTGRSVMTNSFVAVGKDGLTNDHPVSIKYIVGNASLREINTVLSTTNSSAAEWLGATTVQDLLRGPNKDTVECSSCHDPHDTYFGMYRRMNNNDGKFWLS